MFFFTVFMHVHSKSLILEFSLLYKVIWADQQIVKRRVRRDYNPHYNDPDYGKQWFLVSISQNT